MNQKMNVLFLCICAAIFQSLFAAAAQEVFEADEPGSIVSIYFVETPSLDRLTQLEHVFFGLCTKLEQIILPEISDQLNLFFAQLKPQKIRIEEASDAITTQFVRDGEHRLAEATIADCACFIKKKFKEYNCPLRQKIFSGLEGVLSLFFFRGHLPS